MKQYLTFLPNALTLGNLALGVLSILALFDDRPLWAVSFLLVAMLLDFFDGFAARLLGVTGELGKQLDSLADLVSFGLAPAIWLLFALKKTCFCVFTNDADSVLDAVFNKPSLGLPILVVLAAAYRLATFNTDQRQTDKFIGLPTPANAWLIMSIPLATHYDPQGFLAQWAEDPRFLMGVSIFSAWAMTSTIELPSFKMSSLSPKQYPQQYILLLIGLVLTPILGWAAPFFWVVSYLVVGGLSTLKK